jgi:hypothetical protein
MTITDEIINKWWQELDDYEDHLWIEGVKERLAAETAIGSVVRGKSPSDALDEASGWTPTRHTDIKSALRASVQATAIKRDWTVVKQTSTYALAISNWGPKKEFKLIKSPDDPGVTYTQTKVRPKPGRTRVVWTRNLTADERGEQE